MNKRRLVKRIFSVKDEHSFNETALNIFRYQYQHIGVYRYFIDILRPPYPKHYTHIPFLPISFFKTHRVAKENKDSELVFRSSGTTQTVRSTHFVEEASLYIRSFETAYRSLIGNPEQQVILALLPNYIEQGESSLVYMVERLIQQTKSPLSSFILGKIDQIETLYRSALYEKKQVIIFGVSYALLDLAERDVSLPEAIIIETGGMKGRRAELTKDQLHETLKNGLHTDHVFSEYGMTELLSQAYSVQDGWFQSPAWMKVLVRDVNDVFSDVPEGKVGRICVIDLANIDSCSFIETEDLGRQNGDLFQVVGRVDRSELRGCNLLYHQG